MTILQIIAVLFLGAVVGLVLWKGRPGPDARDKNRSGIGGGPGVGGSGSD